MHVVLDPHEPIALCDRLLYDNSVSGDQARGTDALHTEIRAHGLLGQNLLCLRRGVVIRRLQDRRLKHAVQRLRRRIVDRAVYQIVIVVDLYAVFQLTDAFLSRTAQKV